MKKAKIEHITPIGLQSAVIFFVFDTSEHLLDEIFTEEREQGSNYLTVTVIDRIKERIQLSINIDKIEFIGHTYEYTPPKEGLEPKSVIDEFVKNNVSMMMGLDGKVLIVEGKE